MTRRYHLIRSDRRVSVDALTVQTAFPGILLLAVQGSRRVVAYPEIMS